jgi:hypothetical protein
MILAPGPVGACLHGRYAVSGPPQAARTADKVSCTTTVSDRAGSPGKTLRLAMLL